MLYKTRVTMDITNSDIRVVSFQGKKIKKWMSSPIPDGLIKDGVIKDPRAMAVMVEALFRTLKLKRRGILCTLTGLPFIFRTINMPGAENKIKVEAIERSARMEMSVTEEDMYLVWQLINNPQNKDETEYFAAGVPRTALNPLLETLSNAGIKPSRIEIKPLALARMVSYTNALVVSLEKEYFDIVLVYDGLIRVIHSFGNAIKPSDTVGLVNELVDGLNITTKSFNRDFPQSELPEDIPVLISGNMASNRSVLDMLQEATGYPVSPVESTLPLPSSLPPELYAANLGLVLSQTQAVWQQNRYYDIGVNLLEGLKKRKTKNINAGYVLALSAAIILLVFLFKINDLRTEAAQHMKTLENKAARESQIFGDAQKTKQEAEAMKQAGLEKHRLLDSEHRAVQEKNRTINELKTDFASSINLIAASLPEDMSFNSIAMQQSAIIITGTARDSLDIVTLSENLEAKNSAIEARVKGIDPLEEGGVSFQVVITTKSSNIQLFSGVMSEQIKP
jgi:hypothetical protein